MYKVGAFLCLAATTCALKLKSQLASQAIVDQTCPVNVLKGASATQSSTYTQSYNAAAANAVDGSPSCMWSAANTLSSTNSEHNPWWQADMGASKDIRAIVVKNR